MGKHIPIDDLFRDKLSDGEEQLNLGAWANMERMLDGKNPYEEEDKRKRRILPFILLFTLLGGAVTAGYLALTKGHKASSSTETVATAPQAQTLAANYTPQNNISNSNEAQTALIPTGNSEGIAINQTNPTAIHNSSTVADVANYSNTSSSTTKTNGTKSRKETATSKNQLKTASNHALEGKNVASDQNGNLVKADQAKQNKNNKEVISSKTNDSNQSSEGIASSKQDTKNSNVAKENINQFEINQKVKLDRKGNPSIEFDTIANSQYTVEKGTETDNLNALTPEQTNPRLVSISPEQELAMNSAAPQHQKEEAPQPKLIATTPQEASAPKLNETHANKPEGESFFSKLRTFAVVNAQKMSLLTTSLINMGYPMIPGISVGVNAAIFNPKNNFGGFHVGVNNLKPLSDRFSILTELKYYIRNNSGYTIDDITTVNKNIAEDKVTLADQDKTIYTYQVDSTVSNYNFKNFSSLEMPLMLQFHMRSFTAYGGVNMAYIFKLNVKENKKNYVLNKEEILDNTVVFAPKEEMIKRYSRDDFSSRFGLGYTVGAAFNFNPNLYIDVRLTQNVWDNARTIASREVSAGYFKVPTLQLSLGYRFKQFVPGK